MTRFYRLCNLFCIVTGFAVFMGYNAVFCGRVTYKSCGNPGNCKAVKIAINPCPEAVHKKTCKLHRGTNVTWTFAFTPKFSGKKVAFRSYSHTEFEDIPYPEHDRNACHYTKCPFVSGKRRIIKYTTAVLESYPPATYTSKWIVRSKKKECCWLVPIDIV